MSTESNSVMQVSLTTAMNPNLFRADEPMARKPERAEASFVDTIVGRRGGLRSILSQLKAVAPTNANVLITDETGSGKAVIAQAVHELSPRRTKKLNCAAMPGLLDSDRTGRPERSRASVGLPVEAGICVKMASPTHPPTVEVAMREQLVAARYVDGSIDFVEMVMRVAKYGLSLERTLSWTQSANVLVF